MECATFSRARERPLPGGPTQLRSDSEPLGLSTLQQQDRARVQEANLLAQFTAQIALVTHHAGGSAVLENPRNTYYWAMPDVAALLTSGFQDFDYHSCAWGGPDLRSNVFDPIA
eukprot:2245492-Amphidinium_carterae.1